MLIIYYRRKRILRYFKHTHLQLKLITTYFCDFKFRKFKIIDDDGSKTISRPEFKKAVGELGLDLDKAAIEECFNAFDRDGSGTIDFDEFLAQLRVSSTNSGRSRISQTEIVVPGPKRPSRLFLAIYSIKNEQFRTLCQSGGSINRRACSCYLKAKIWCTS